MPKHVLVPVDGSPQSLSAIEFVSGEWADAQVTLLHVINPVEAGYSAGVLPSGSEEWYQEAKVEADEILREARERLDVDSEVTTDTEVGGPAATIVEAAETRDVDHVVIGSHGRSGVSRLVLGSVAEDVVRHSPVPVTVFR
ncbi:universal stress protein [Halobellus ordinarius]|uniref:universal stress protein n=1 Tax=Halobellus ordinarius TaxID=3075120 RepID=UPI0028807DDE|nr:universal stress protein [Halobellus sp. ZY16]